MLPRSPPPSPPCTYREKRRFHKHSTRVRDGKSLRLHGACTMKYYCRVPRDLRGIFVWTFVRPFILVSSFRRHTRDLRGLLYSGRTIIICLFVFFRENSVLLRVSSEQMMTRSYEMSILNTAKYRLVDSTVYDQKKKKTKEKRQKTGSFSSTCFTVRFTSCFSLRQGLR